MMSIALLSFFTGAAVVALVRHRHGSASVYSGGPSLHSVHSPLFLVADFKLHPEVITLKVTSLDSFLSVPHRGDARLAIKAETRTFLLLEVILLTEARGSVRILTPER